MEELNSVNVIDLDDFQPDPLLKPGAFIDPNPTVIGTSFTVDPVVMASPPPISDKKSAGPSSNGNSKPVKSTASPAAAAVDADQLPDWMPPGWTMEHRVRASGASAGSRDKYYREPGTSRKFRSKKEVMHYLETGTLLKRKNIDDAGGSPVNESATPKRKKSEPKVKVSLKNFNFDDIPAKVKWVLTDIYEGSWRPLTNGVDRVPESAKQEWTAAYTYLTIQNGGKAAITAFV
ncbi:hypothetical protein SOVF_188950 [Spinacia oleracea]|uniref:Methyl-CpG-binding domain-containing protein 5 n=1 Tax=Spinacia oleracea TaxID=3562 RepID=A0A9R0I305_SPIOL|nr:methyl-CpG-binding domain-containing protein 5-like [Spinacia oleracea]KNA05589.1 hypothetical protein SOVF_188950 [Spinacia oleracea]